MTKANESSLTAAFRDDDPGAIAAVPVMPRWPGVVGLVLGGLAAIVIAVACLIPAEPPQGPGSGIDKLYHFIAYLGLVVPLIATDPRRWVWVVPAAILFGGAIELIQPHFGRTAELLDFGANVTGVLTGWVLGELLYPRLCAFYGVPLAEAQAEAGATPDKADDEPGDGSDDQAAADAARARREALMAELRAALHDELDSPDRPIRRQRSTAPVMAAHPVAHPGPLPMLRLT